MFIPHPADDGTWIDMELCFLALDGTMDSGKVLSREITGAWINEAREIHFTNIKDVIGRYGRFPKVDKSYNYGPTWCGVIMDTNAPSDQHWWYRMFEVEKPPKWQLFKQPGALMENPDGDGYVPNPDAENIDNIHQGYGYYFRMLAGADQQEIQWKILGRYATSYEGKPVYDLYDDERHCSKESLAIFRGLPLYLGWDFGRDAACVAAQLSPEGQLRVLREWILKDGHLLKFAETIVRPALKNEFYGMRIISTGDPSGPKNPITGTSAFDELRQMGIPTMKAVTNDFQPRRSAIMSFMSRNVSDGEPAYLLDPSCKVLREGKRGAYQFALMKTTIDEAYRPLPDKNFYSHPADAEQYIGLAVTHSRPPTNRVGRRSLVSAAEAWGALE